MIAFYDVDENYINFLKKYDRQIPNIKYEGNNKFVCGIVLDIDGISYYAPISHMADKKQTNLRILDKGKPISTIRFSFMFPAFDEVLTKKEFADIAKTNKAYADLLATEYEFCKNNILDIHKKALSVYKIGCNKNHKLNYTCCDFKKLEEHYLEFKENKDNPAECNQ